MFFSRHHRCKFNIAREPFGDAPLGNAARHGRCCPRDRVQISPATSHYQFKDIKILPILHVYGQAPLKQFFYEKDSQFTELNPLFVDSHVPSLRTDLDRQRSCDTWTQSTRLLVQSANTCMTKVDACMIGLSAEVLMTIRLERHPFHGSEMGHFG